MPTDYPEDSIQAFVEPWWVKSDSKEIERGCLVRVLVPYPAQKPLILIPEGRGEDPTDHTTARVRIEPFVPGQPPREAKLPVAGLPLRPGESFLASRGKVRPCVVLSMGGTSIEKALRRGGSAWQSAGTLLVAPFYGADHDGSRGGWDAELVKRIRRAEYPQYLLDRLPLTGSVESILRFDHIFPIGQDHASFRLTGFCLSPEAMRLVDEWLVWLFEGQVRTNSDLAYLAQSLRELADPATP